MTRFEFWCRGLAALFCAIYGPISTHPDWPWSQVVISVLAVAGMISSYRLSYCFTKRGLLQDALLASQQERLSELMKEAEAKDLLRTMLEGPMNPSIPQRHV